MWKYFVEATAQIIREEGIENVTIRKIADIAGYNSATIYNYFSEISHLVFFASLKFMKQYTEEVAQVYKRNDLAPMEKYLRAWELFCQHSFQNPSVFHAVFIADLGSHPEDLLKHYYSVYPSEIIGIPEEIKPVILEHNISKRGRVILEFLVKEGLMKEENVDAINELTIMIWQGMFTTFLNNRSTYDPEEATRKIMLYIREIMRNANHFSFADEPQSADLSS
ncbi:TetR/AcrR family transcriptional regulator [Brevibacillus composti]|uniref:TetR/AcrR family transcriptional regulator n=2 Tax=Brevibacillus composti TaxID=2796470 RepID=A0A7T5EPN5_9BACL|nr:TetR/AcrR family transcriptional regulator [Brevibacillus composti]QUO43543.1 TetR/AcrR family transcriptional regulator [Brevibacillus composti]